ncbi:hypothetical protein [Rhodococcus sp. ACT016]|uniref:hypothetical protein n=1 Tax=Rhodococcus sp. ACT016 TaxID=3134808 RepID=UPI003D2B892E
MSVIAHLPVVCATLDLCLSLLFSLGNGDRNHRTGNASQVWVGAELAANPHVPIPAPLQLLRFA